jgi:hydrogenase-4 membrane subunit HyfE
MNILLLQSLLGVIFLTLVFLHNTKNNFSASIAYAVQSFVVMIILINSFFETGNINIYIVVLLTLIIKVFLAPSFFIRLIKTRALSSSVSTYLNSPFTLISIAMLTFLAHSQKFSPLTAIVPANHILLSLALSCIFLSLFLIINRKGVLSQILGILSLENSIVIFVIFAGLDQSPGLQVGIIFNILVWIIIATVFASKIYEHFGSYDVTSMKELKD